ncbi:hypothetical protein SAMN05421833_12978 [Microbispora rosea]|uniref:Uncharacterized protein n=1 Tax=Microbispora rosea TaxID=58117 RepID=A0A1N7GIS4_9ACTN|nr:hypothetical protein [Microbispora rosea]GIH51671.1 hypothetical protein Mro03_68500 [Microbispora rosea subsp. rosea]SIS12503.1 hypothetical protein SAMN05421833_12978 [Microbispora rosea]
MDPVTLQQILDALAAGDAQALAALLAREDVNLSELEQQALAEFDGIRARQAEGLTADDVTALEALADAVDAIRTEGGRREQVAAEQTAQVEAIAQRIAAPAAADGEARRVRASRPSSPPARPPRPTRARRSPPPAVRGRGSSSPRSPAATASPPLPRSRPRRTGPRCSPPPTCPAWRPALGVLGS